MDKKIDHHRCYSLVSTNIGVNFSTPQEIKQMIDPNASYQLIPTVAEVFSDDTISIIISLLPMSKLSLIDICLPFNYYNRRRCVSHWARYLLLNQKIIGIRIRTGENWSRYRRLEYRLPQEIIRYYNQNNLSNFLNENNPSNTCVIGQFYLSLRSMKIALLFASEIQNNPGIISQYESYGCDILSIIDDVQVDNIGDICLPIKNLMSKIDQRQMVVMVAGTKCSINPIKCYWTNSFVSQGSIKKQAFLHPFSGWSNCQLTVSIENILNSKNYSAIEKKIRDYKAQEPIVVDLKAKSEIIHPAYPHASYKDQDKKPQYRIDSNMSKSILYLWYIFNKLTKQQPFTVGVPFSQIVFSMVYLLNDLRAIMKMMKIQKKLLQIYHFPHVDARTTNFWPSNLEVCNEADYFPTVQLMLQSPSKKKFYIFCQYLQEFKYFKEKTTQLTNLYLCKSLLVDKFLVDKKVDRSYLRSLQNNVVRWSSDKSVERLCEQILNKKLFTLQDMVKQFLERKQDVQQLVEAFTQIMPGKIRLNINFHPPHNFLLYNSKQRIRSQLMEIQTNLQINNQKISSAQKAKALEQKNKFDLQGKIKETRQSKSTLKKSFSTCHCCQQVVKKNLARQCQKCKNEICIECLSRKFANRNSQYTEFQKMITNSCPICNQTCRCRYCTQKIDRKQKQQEQKRSKTQLTQYHIRTCLLCSLTERKRKAIDIQCQSCHNVYCIQCIKIEEGIMPKYYLEDFYCKDCRSIYVIKKKKINEMVDQQKQKQKNMNTQLLPNETVEQLRLIKENQQKQRVTMFDEKLRGDIQKKSSSSDSPSRSRNKKHKNKKKKLKSSSSSSSSNSSSSSSSSSSSQKKKKQKVHQSKKVQKKTQKNDRSASFSQKVSQNNRKFDQSQPNQQGSKPNYQKDFSNKKKDFQNNNKFNSTNRFNSNKNDKYERKKNINDDYNKKGYDKQQKNHLWNASEEVNNKNKNQKQKNQSNFIVAQPAKTTYEQFDY